MELSGEDRENALSIDSDGSRMKIEIRETVIIEMESLILHFLVH